MEVTDECNEEIKAIENLAALLQGGDKPINDWFDHLKHIVSDVDPFTSVHDTVKKKSSCDMAEPLLPKLLQLLQECMLNQRWPESLSVLHKIAKVPSGSSHTIWKVGNELLQSDQDNVDDLVKQFYDQMKQLSDLNCKEVLMEFVMFLVNSGNMEAAITATQEHKTRPGVKKEKSERDHYVDKIFRAYTGLLWYIKWKNCVSKEEEAQIDEMLDKPKDSQVMPMGSQMQNIHMQVLNYSSKAIMCFEEVAGYQGVWDIFVTKHAELLVYNDRIDDGLTLLQTYCDLNENNINAHKYLYAYYRDHFPASHNELKELKTIAELQPSDSLVLVLYSKIKNEDLSLAIKHLFMLLDYPCWQYDVAPWTMLADCLEAVCINRVEHFETALDSVHSCWRDRQAWWPPFHFTKHMVAMETKQYGVNFYKSVTACILCGKDNKFTKKASRNFSSEELEELENIQEKCNDGIT